MKNIQKRITLAHSQAFEGLPALGYAPKHHDLAPHQRRLVELPDGRKMYVPK